MGMHACTLPHTESSGESGAHNASWWQLRSDQQSESYLTEITMVQCNSKPETHKWGKAKNWHFMNPEGLSTIPVEMGRKSRDWQLS